MLNDIFSNLHFIRPLVFLSLPVVLLVLWYLQRKTKGDDGWSKICDPHLLDAIKINSAGKGSRWSLVLWPISLIAIIAIAGPAFRKLPTPVIKNQSALIIALDVSRSMLADDIKPNRLERAKFKINDILAMRKDGQTALLVYAGDAFMVTPLTDDTETIALMLKAITPDIMPVQGSRVDIALIKAQELLKQTGYLSGDVLLITDGVNSAKAEKSAQVLADNNIKTSVLAIGTKEGAPIPTQAGFVKDSTGNIVIPKLPVLALRDLSDSGDGKFAQITGDSSDIDFLLPTQIKNDGTQKSDKDDEFGTENYIDEGPWLTLLLLPLVALLFRKGVLLALFLVVGLQSPQSSNAFSWDDLWLNSDQQAVKKLGNGEYKQALSTANSNAFKAAAAYKSKDFKQAQELFNEDSADGFYNKGNALAQSGQLQEAIDAYDKALKKNPTDEDTIYNKKQVEQALEKQKEQEKKQQEQKDKEKKDQEKKDQEKKDQEEQDKKDQEQDNQDQKDSENQDQKEGEDGEKQDSKPQDGEDNPDKKKKDPSEMTEEEKKEQEEKQKELEKADKEAKEKEEQEKQQQEQKEVKLTPQEMAQDAEKKEAIEQWLRRIPDDPGGLLRRKFYYQYNQQNNKPDETDDW
jgi:Ca-activated chloride channel family protein